MSILVIIVQLRQYSYWNRKHKSIFIIFTLLLNSLLFNWNKNIVKTENIKVFLLYSCHYSCSIFVLKLKTRILLEHKSIFIIFTFLSLLSSNFCLVLVIVLLLLQLLFLNWNIKVFLLYRSFFVIVLKLKQESYWNIKVFYCSILVFSVVQFLFLNWDKISCWNRKVFLLYTFLLNSCHYCLIEPRFLLKHIVQFETRILLKKRILLKHIYCFQFCS